MVTHDSFIPSAVSYHFNCNEKGFLSLHKTPIEMNRQGKAFLKLELSLLE